MHLLRPTLEVLGEVGPVPAAGLLLEAGTVPQEGQVPVEVMVPMADLMVLAEGRAGEVGPAPAVEAVRAMRVPRPTSMDMGRLRVMARFNNISSCR